MISKPRYAKIAITIPEDDLAAADALARERDRSRSWVISEAVRRFTADPGRSREAGSSRGGIGALRRAQLVADLRLSPEARVLAAERTAQVGQARGRPRGQRVIGFDRYEHYLEWKRREETGG